MRQTVESVHEIKPASDVPDGTFAAVMTGYHVRWSAEGRFFKARVSTGAHGSTKCLVRVTDGVVTVEDELT